MNNSGIQIDHWRELLASSRADQAAWTVWAEENECRASVRGPMTEFLNKYLSGQCDTETLRATFDSKTRKEWAYFGFKGMSGAMFLNLLVKHISDAQELAQELREVLRVPNDSENGRARMGRFAGYLDRLIQQGQASKGQIQPARLPFFISAWWHVQDTERWPVFYLSGRKTLEKEGEFSPTGAAVQDYFTFRDRFLLIAAALQMSSWDYEHLLDWHDKHPIGGVASVVETTPATEDKPSAADEQAEPQDESTHNHVQWLLAKIGHKVGCKVWVAANDHSREWKGQKLGDLSIKELPMLGLDPESQKIVRLIDVVWIKGTHQIVAAFEIEHTTSIFSGILRMSDLVALSPNLSFPLYLVAPEKRLPQVRAQLLRPTFQTLELHERCGFFSDEVLIQESGAIMQWATSPDVIEKLASKVADAKST